MGAVDDHSNYVLLAGKESQWITGQILVLMEEWHKTSGESLDGIFSRVSPLAKSPDFAPLPIILKKLILEEFS